MITKYTSVTRHSYKIFLVMRTFKKYSLSNFQIYSTLLLTSYYVIHSILMAY